MVGCQAFDDLPWIGGGPLDLPDRWCTDRARCPDREYRKFRKYWTRRF